MSSPGGVEAFLAAKWKSKKTEMENESDEHDEPVSEQEFQEMPNVSTSNPQTPHESPETRQNAPQNDVDYFAALQEEIKVSSFTRTMIASDDVDPISVAKTSNYDDKNGSSDEEQDTDEETARGNIKARVQLGDSNIFNGMEDEDVTISQMETATRDEIDEYETGDVWGLLEQQNDENELEEHGPRSSDRNTKGVKPTEPVGMMFGALNTEHANKISMASFKEGQGPTELASGVPKMAIPFSNFGKLLEQPRNEPVTDPLMPNTLYDQGVLNDNSHRATTNSQQMDRNKQGAQQVDTKPKPASRKRARAQNTPHNKTHCPEGMEPDSTTKSRQTPPNSGTYQHLQTDSSFGTHTAIADANLNQRPLIPKPPQHNNWHSEVTNSTVSESTFTSTYDPLLGPSSTNLDITKGVLPISRFKTNLDPLAKTVAYNVVKYFQNRKQQFHLSFNELRVASEATGMAKSMLTKILSEAHENIQQNSKLFECKSRKLRKNTFSEPNVKRDCIARMFIHNSYLIKKEVPTLEKMIENCQQNGFEKVLGTKASCVRSHLKKLGFEYNAKSGNKRFLIERPDFIAQRIRYLEAIQEHRKQQRNIVFVFTADMLKKGMRDVEWEGWDGVFHETEHGVDIGCVSVLHAASKNFVFHDCLQVIEYEVNSHIGLPRKPFIQWLTTRLLPQVPKGSVIVLGDQRFHQIVDLEERPHIGCTKEQIADWLRQHNVASNDSWPKALLLERVQKVVLDQQYTIDEGINSLGFIPVHVPLHHRDLNPLSFLWQDIKDKLDNTPDVSNLRTLRQYVKDEFTKAAVKLGKAWIQVEKLEKSYYNIDMHTDDEKQELILKYGDGLIPIDSETEIQSSDDDEAPVNKTAKMNNPH